MPINAAAAAAPFSRSGRRAFAGMALAAVTVLAGSRAKAAQTVTLAQNLSPISGITIVALARGIFAAHGLDVVVSNFTTGKQCLDAVLGGGAEIATTAESPVTAAAMANQPISFLARMEYSDLKTLTSKAANIHSPADLRGKRIGYTVGTGAEVYTMALLKRGGLTAADVTLINLRPQDMVAAMASGSIDAYNIFEPYIGNGKKILGDAVTELDTAGVYAETFNIVTMKSYLAAHPDTIKAFLRSLLEAEAWMKANREDAIKTVATVVNIGPADLTAIWDNFVYGVRLDQRTMDVLNQHAAWRLASGNHPPGATMPDWKQVIDAGPLRAIAPDRVTVPE